MKKIGRKPVQMALVLGALAVILGAFGAHGLQATLTVERMQTWQTAVFYQFVHVFLVLYLANREYNQLNRQAMYFSLAGILLFSGSLYLLCLTGITALGMITPIGGVCFILAWLLALYETLKA